MAQIKKGKPRDVLRIDLNMPAQENPEDAAILASTGNWRRDIAEANNDLKPDDFENIQKLGEGAAGTVWKVAYKPTGAFMAKKVKIGRIFLFVFLFFIFYICVYTCVVFYHKV